MSTNWQGTERQGANAPTDFSHLIRRPPQPPQPPATNPIPESGVSEGTDAADTESDSLLASLLPGLDTPAGPEDTSDVNESTAATAHVSVNPQPASATDTVSAPGDSVEDWTSAPGDLFRGRRATLLQAKATSAALAAPTTGFPALVRKLTFGLAKPKVGAAELALREHIAATQRQFSRPMTVVVANGKGGIGKTMTTVCLGGTFGYFRGGSVVAVDNNESYGTLDVRTMSNGGTKTVIDLLADLERFNRVDARSGDLGGYWRAQPNAHFDVLVSDQDSSRMEEFGAQEFRAIHALLTRFRDLVIVDTGNNIRRPNFLAAIAACDQLVIPTNLGLDSIRAVSLMIDQLDDMGRGELVANAVVIVTGAGGEGQDPAVRAGYLANLSSWCRAVIQIPHDSHLGMKSIIDYHLLTQPTRNAFLAATAAIAEGLGTKDHTTNTPRTHQQGATS